jgi:hypothetical protein
MFYVGEIVVIHTKVWSKFVLLVLSGPDTDGVSRLLQLVSVFQKEEIV